MPVYACSKAVESGPYISDIARVVGAGVASLVCSKNPEITSSLMIAGSVSSATCVGMV